MNQIGRTASESACPKQLNSSEKKDMSCLERTIMENLMITNLNSTNPNPNHHHHSNNHSNNSNKSPQHVMSPIQVDTTTTQKMARTNTTTMANPVLMSPNSQFAAANRVVSANSNQTANATQFIF